MFVRPYRIASALAVVLGARAEPFLPFTSEKLKDNTGFDTLGDNDLNCGKLVAKTEACYSLAGAADAESS